MASTRYRAPLLACLVVLLGVGVASFAAAQERWGYDLADELMSPYCPGRALSECPSPQAGELRSWILAQEDAGVPRQDVEAELYQVWGDQLRQAPRADGVGLVAYVIPAVAFALGGALVTFFLFRQRASRAAAAGLPQASPDTTAPDSAEAALEKPPDEDEISRQVDEEMGRSLAQ